MPKKLLILALLLLLMCKHSLSNVKPVTEPLKIVEWQKIYRWCLGKYYILNSYTDQTIIGEVKYEEVDKEEGIIFYGNCEI